jgi:DNA-binding transcriptional ArsR family regulator
MKKPSEPEEQALENALARFREIHRWQEAQTQELATLAARICPALCQENPSRAIEIAKALKNEARKKVVKVLRDLIWEAKIELETEYLKVDLEKAGAVDKDKEEIAEGIKKARLAALRSGKVTEFFFDTRYVRSFEPGVKFITREKRLDRAMPWFRKFIGSRTPNEQACNMEIAKARKDGFPGPQLLSLSLDFRDWKAKEKSRIAKTKSAKRKKKD